MIRTGKPASAIFVAFVLLSRIFPQASPRVNEQSAESLLKYTLQVSGVVGEEIWPGYNPEGYVYIVPSTESGGSRLGFSPDRQQSMIAKFDVSKYSLEEGLSLVFHEAFHAFERDQSFLIKQV